MIAVIFQVELNHLDDEYYQLSRKLRSLALEKYGCIRIVSATENGKEISISYWDSLSHVEAWRNDPEHRLAQRKALQKWYKRYSVQIVEVLKAYESQAGSLHPE